MNKNRQFFISYIMKNKKANHFRENLVEQLELPKDLMLGAALVSVTGQREMLIENYKGILEYENHVIRVQTKDCRIKISGAHLVIAYYTNEEMKITGYIESILYEP